MTAPTFLPWPFPSCPANLKSLLGWLNQRYRKFLAFPATPGYLKAFLPDADGQPKLDADAHPIWLWIDENGKCRAPTDRVYENGLFFRKMPDPKMLQVHRRIGHDAIALTCRWLHFHNYHDAPPWVPTNDLDTIEGQLVGLMAYLEKLNEPAAIDRLEAVKPDSEHKPAEASSLVTTSGFLGGEALAESLGVHPSRRPAFFKRLERDRLSLGDSNWQEVDNRRANAPRYQYRVDSPRLRELAEGYRLAKPD